jgi:hypothetical protein
MIVEHCTLIGKCVKSFLETTNLIERELNGIDHWIVLLKVTFLCGLGKQCGFRCRTFEIQKTVSIVEHMGKY